MHLTEVHVRSGSLAGFAPLVGQQQVEALERAAGSLKEALAGRAVWNLNSTAAGGGVAEMLQPLLAYARGAGVDARWLVIRGDDEFFRITKRLHHAMHGMPGDGSELGDDQRRHYDEVLARNATELRALVRPDDIVLLHDPQTAGLVPAMRAAGTHTIWRCHIGTELINAHTDAAWAFLRPSIQQADAVVLSRKAYAPPWLASRAVIIPPSIDPFSPKNADLAPGVAASILAHVGILQETTPGSACTFTRRDGSPGRVDHCADIVRAGPSPTASARLIVQVSRWDPLKDMAGVMRAFALHLADIEDVHLALVGPNVTGVADDPEGALVLQHCIDAWRSLPHAARVRVQLVCLPMSDIEENAAIVNAAQRHATVVVQKSLAEGFGLTVAEAMWKSRPVVASGVGGILDQIVDGESGLLVRDPTDPAAFGRAVRGLLEDPARARALGERAHTRVLEQFIGTRHLMQYAALLLSLATPDPPTDARRRPNVVPLDNSSLR
jgi:trehalose synthase